MQSAQGDFCIHVTRFFLLSTQLIFLMLMDIQSLAFRDVEEAKDKRQQIVFQQRAKVSRPCQGAGVGLL